MANTIFLKGKPIRKEGIAGGAITPGHFIKLNSSGALVVCAAGDQSRSVAFENELIGNDINDAYASGDGVLYGDVHAGQEVYALVPAAASAIVVGDYLSLGAGGTVVLTVTTAVRIGKALQAVDNSGGGTAVRIVMAIL